MKKQGHEEPWNWHSKTGLGAWRSAVFFMGEFHFPNHEAAKIAVDTVRKYKGNMEVIFNVFKDVDYEIYRELLG